MRNWRNMSSVGSAIAMTGKNLEYTVKGMFCGLAGLTAGSARNGASNTYILLHAA